MALEFNRLSIVDYGGQFLLPKTDQHLFHPLFAAVTMKLCRDFFRDFRMKFSQKFI